VFLKVAEDCETRIAKPFSLLRVALCCRVLRPQWCQSGVNWSPSTSRFMRSLKKLSEANHIMQRRSQSYEAPANYSRLSFSPRRSVVSKAPVRCTTA
jgi:hypothetical protein